MYHFLHFALIAFVCVNNALLTDIKCLRLLNSILTIEFETEIHLMQYDFFFEKGLSNISESHPNINHGYYTRICHKQFCLPGLSNSGTILIPLSLAYSTRSRISFSVYTEVGWPAPWNKTCLI